MQRLDTSLPGVWEFQPNVFRDARGYFIETYHVAKFAELGVTDTFVQDNQSCSERGTLRGLHYQLRHAQAKLCRVIQGEALDVALDIRCGSPNFGRWAVVVLSAEKQNQLYIPAGFAHGFLALSERVQFLYKCSDFHHAEDERGILWNDPQVGIPWPITAPLLSEKDNKLSELAGIPREFLPQYPK